MEIVEESGDRVAIRVRVQPRASRDEIVGWTGAGELRIRVKAPPVDDRANRAVIDLFAAFFSVPRREVEITSGATGRLKRLTLPKSCKNRLLSLGHI